MHRLFVPLCWPYCPDRAASCPGLRLRELVGMSSWPGRPRGWSYRWSGGGTAGGAGACAGPCAGACAWCSAFGDLDLGDLLRRRLIAGGPLLRSRMCGSSELGPSRGIAKRAGGGAPVDPVQPEGRHHSGLGQTDCGSVIVSCFLCCWLVSCLPCRCFLIPALLARLLLAVSLFFSSGLRHGLQLLVQTFLVALSTSWREW